MGGLGPVRRVPLADVAYEDRWGQRYRVSSDPKRPELLLERLPDQRDALPTEFKTAPKSMEPRPRRAAALVGIMDHPHGIPMFNYQFC
jgi:hypothetical protein